MGASIGRVESGLTASRTAKCDPYKYKRLVFAQFSGVGVRSYTEDGVVYIKVSNEFENRNFDTQTRTFRGDLQWAGCQGNCGIVRCHFSFSSNYDRTESG